MSVILNKVPFLEKNEDLFFPKGKWPFQQNQIIIWIGLVNPNDDQQEENGYPYFPAILDTGCGANLHINEKHLTGWTGKTIDYFELQESRPINNVDVNIHMADVLIYPNVPGKIEVDLRRQPELVELSAGIAVQSKESAFPRVPLIGMALLKRAKFHIEIDCENSFVTITR